MKVQVRVLALAPLALAAACAAHRPTSSDHAAAGGGVIIGQAPTPALSAASVAGPLGAPPLLAPAALAPTLGAAPMEPLGCPIYGGSDRPDYDAQGLQCVVQWIRQAQDYLAEGGKPTKYTNAATLEQYRGFARVFTARLNAFVAGARWEASSSGKQAPTAAPALTPGAATASATSEQAFLNGMVYFQKGDYVHARAEWTLAVKLDAANVDARSGLARLDAIEGR